MKNRVDSIARLSISGLNGGGTVEFDIQADYGFSVLYGRNGIGKSTLFDILHCLSHLQFYDLIRHSFSSVRIEYSNRSLVECNKSSFEIDDFRNKIICHSLQFEVSSPGNDRIQYTWTDESFIRFLLTKDLVPIEGNKWYDPAKDQFTSYDQLLLSLLPVFIVVKSFEGSLIENMIPELLVNKLRCISTIYINSNKGTIVTNKFNGKVGYQIRRDLGVVDALNRIIEPTLTELRSAVLKTLRQSVGMHSLLVYRLRDGHFDEKIDQSAVKEKLAKVGKLYRNIDQVFGFGFGDALDIELSQLSKLDDESIRLLDSNLTDVWTKHSPLYSILKKITHLKETLDGMLDNVEVVFDFEKGLHFKGKDSGQPIPFGVLSSGEQSLVLLFSKLTFTCDSKSLVLIDEPEISLHVVWQLKLIDEIIKFSELIGFQFIIATHSPSVVNTYWDQAYDLGDSDEISEQ